MKHRAGDYERDAESGLLLPRHERRGGPRAHPAVSVGPTFFAAAAGVSGPLDSYTTNLWGAYSVHRLLSSYAGSAFRIRRSSDDTEQDIPLGSSTASSSAALAFTGSGSGLIRWLYEQTGTSRHLGQSTAANQPRIVNSGVYDGKIVFDGTNDGLISNLMSGSQTALTFYIRGTIRSVATDQIMLEMSANFGGNLNALALYYSVSDARMTAYINRTGTGNANLYTAYPNNNVHCYVFDPSQSGAAKIKQYVAGSLQSPASSPSAGTSTASMGSYTYYLGARNGGSTSPTTLDLNTFVIYTAAHDATTVAAISALIP